MEKQLLLPIMVILEIGKIWSFLKSTKNKKIFFKIIIIEQNMYAFAYYKLPLKEEAFG